MTRVAPPIAPAPRAAPGRRRARRGMQAAAVGMAVLDAASLSAHPHAIDGLKLSETPAPLPAGDAYQTGRGLLAVGDLTGAMAAFREALLAAPQSVDALNGLAVCYDRLGRFDLARSYYDSALAIDPASAIVLNNLGYSLYLQGQFDAAIPILQKAVANGDLAAAANGRRLLTLIAARIADNVAHEGTALAKADSEAPHSRIEVSSNGEQRLVLGGPAPEARLTASLGDAATLVLVAKPWTAADERKLELAAAASAKPAAASLPHVALADAAPVLTLPAAPGVQVAALTGDATAALHAEVQAAPPSPDSQAARTRRRAAAATPAARAKPDAAGVAVTARSAGLAARAVQDADLPPAWLLASRRSDQVAGGASAIHGPLVDGGSVRFDSDDVALNAFAARMRGDAGVAAVVTTEVAVARLEALIARIRAA